MTPDSAKNQACGARLRNLRPKRILILGRECIGDIVNSTGAILALRSAFPESYLVLEVGEQAQETQEVIDGVDEFWTRPRHQGFFGKYLHVGRVALRRFDAVFVLESSNRMIFESFLAGIPLRIGLSKDPRSSLYSASVVQQNNIHECRDNFDALLTAVGLAEFLTLPKINIGRFRDPSRELLLGTGWQDELPSVALHCCRPNIRRNWPTTVIQEVAVSLTEVGCQPILLGSQADREYFDSNSLNLPDGTFDLIGKMGLGATAGVLSLCHTCVVPDSGLMHIAATLGLKVVALYQNSNNPVCTGPVGDGHHILVAERLEEILPGRIIEAVISVLAS